MDYLGVILKELEHERSGIVNSFHVYDDRLVMGDVEGSYGVHNIPEFEEICRFRLMIREGHQLQRIVASTGCMKGDFIFLSSDECSMVLDKSTVKLRIKSFKVPELFIEIPETATVASLKRTIMETVIVMETVTAILGSGLRVGVLLKGKKVRDDNRTLRQAGIFHGDKLDNLGFILEPNYT